MSQFNLPRINFHGTVYLDTPTANKGKFTPLVFYNQTEAHLPPYPVLPYYLGCNAAFFPLHQYAPSGYSNIMDLNKIFDPYSNKPVTTGYLYEVIESHRANTVTPGGNHSTTVNRTLYQVYMNIPVDIH